jgi:hypothetical protein
MSEKPETVGGVAELYLGNILYALERCALAMAEEGVRCAVLSGDREDAG